MNHLQATFKRVAARCIMDGALIVTESTLQHDQHVHAFHRYRTYQAYARVALFAADRNATRNPEYAREQYKRAELMIAKAYGVEK